jgi:hypothetical protein
MASKIPRWYYGHNTTDEYKMFKKAIKEGDMDTIKFVMDNGIKLGISEIRDVFFTNNIEIIKLILSYNPYFDHYILTHVFYDINDIECIDYVIKYLINNDISLYDIPKIKNTDRFSKGKKDLLHSIIFRQCITTELDILKNNLKDLNISRINGILINDIRSTIELCHLIKENLDFNINKYDNDSYELNTIENDFGSKLIFVD